MRWPIIICTAIYTLIAVVSFHESERVNTCREEPYSPAVSALISGFVSAIWPLNVAIVGTLEVLGADTVLACGTKFQARK